MGTAGRFNKFLSNISVTKQNLDDAKIKYDGVAGKLHSHYYGTPYTGSTALLIGSYGKGTQVRPPRDVDILFLMPDIQFSRYHSYRGNGQSQLLQDVKAVLLQRYPRTGIRGDGQVVVVPFTGGHTVELLPGWRADGKYLVPDTHNGGSWKLVDHAAEIAYVHDSDARSNGNTRSLIKMMKVWQAECNVPIKSLALELRAVNFLTTWKYYDKETVYYDWMVRDYFRELIEKVNALCTIPGIEEKCHYGAEWLSRAQTAYGRAVKACEYESNKQDFDAASEWRKIFGSQYEF